MCVAVGQWRPNESALNGRALIEVWNGTKWAIERPPVPVASKASSLNSVACPSTTSCVAIGGYFNSAGSDSYAFAEVWNGTVWSISPIPDPAPAGSDGLDGISCSSPTACTAVGTSNANSQAPLVTWVERWNGTSWSIQPSPNATGLGSVLAVVSCPSATFCNAVGYSEPNSTDTVPIAETWNGKTWALASVPGVSGTKYAELGGVSCASATSCFAVGYDSPAPSQASALVESWNGSKWVISSSPKGMGVLTSIWCSSSSSCVTVGIGDFGAVSRGSTWTTATLPVPANPVETAMRAVSCSAINACTAVGWVDRPGPKTLALRWNGTGWQHEITPW